MVVFLAISLVKTPPRVSMPSESGVTSRSNTSLTSPRRTPPWIAAPIATHSSGLTLLFGVLPKMSAAVLLTRGIRLMPPTMTTSLISPLVSFASLRQFWHGVLLLSQRAPVSCSSFARLRVTCRCFGPVASAVMNGRLISVLAALESSHLAFSAASFRRCSAIGSAFRSMPLEALKSAASQSMIAASKSSPPRWVSPLVAMTSQVPSPRSRIEISKVPPPRS